MPILASFQQNISRSFSFVLFISINNFTAKEMLFLFVCLIVIFEYEIRIEMSFLPLKVKSRKFVDLWGVKLINVKHMRLLYNLSKIA